MFAQVVMGPPGSGKSTYCNGMQQFMTQLQRKVVVVNLDPANDNVPAKCDIDVRELITLDDVMSLHHLGPNGGLTYCMEFLEANVEWLHTKLKAHQDCYFLFDCPGQVELYTHHHSMRNILLALQKWGIQLTSVYLVDSHYCSDTPKFLSALLVCLSTMLFLETPHVNVLSKIDLVESQGRLAFGLEFYTEPHDLSYLLDTIAADTSGGTRFKQLNDAIRQLVEDFELVAFHTLDVSDKQSMHTLLQEIDRSNGYVFRVFQGLGNNILQMASTDTPIDETLRIQEKYMNVDPASSEEEMNNNDSE
eukprot:c9003_g1_i1.p1 GENE.c9003_g1_i1~~c9003_g1_i1.p1  ORF type:complete len:305 (-),score=53.83 c9003_g1_i1:71-985(-)